MTLFFWEIYVRKFGGNMQCWPHCCAREAGGCAGGVALTPRPIPYPSDTLAKGWRFELDLERVMQSDTWALAAPDVRPWLLMLWATAWQQKPCGSMPSDDMLIAARLGMTVKVFAKVKAILLRGWWLAEDGRLYQDTIVERVLEMLEHKNKEKQRKAAYRARMSGGSPDLSHGTGTGRTEESHGSDDTGTGTGTGIGIGKPTLVAKDETEFQTHTARVTEPGQICKAMKAAGIGDVNPGHPDLLMLLNAGATVAEFTGAATTAASKGKGFAYALGTLKRTRQDAANTAQTLHTGPLPVTTVETDYQRSAREKMTGWAPSIAAKAPGQQQPVTVLEAEYVAAIGSH